MSKPLCAALTLLLAACGERSAPPDILLITVDTLRADHLGCYGYERPTSPNIDELARGAVLFERAYVQWPKTGPSIASLMTSTYGSTSGVMRFTGKTPIPGDYETLAEVLAERGYETLASVTNPSLAPDLAYDQGFDRYVLNYDPERTWDHRADRVLASARELLEGRRGDRPFFLWIHLLDPHHPYTPGDTWFAPYAGDEHYAADDRPPVPLAEDVHDPDAEPCAPVGQIAGRTYSRGLDTVRDYVARYDGEISYFDHELGAFLDWMEQRGELERTVIALTADHGESLGDHELYFEHGRYPYDACGHVPLILRHPDGAPGVVREPVAILDLAPTLVEIAQTRPGRQFEGRSMLARVLGGPPADPPQPVFAESGYKPQFETSVRLREWKLIRFGTEELAAERHGETYELYDVLADPAETVNLALERPDVVAELRALLDPWTNRAYARAPEELEEVVLPDHMLEDLKRLGYVDGR